MLIERKARLHRAALFVIERNSLQQKFYAKIHAIDIAFLLTRVWYDLNENTY